MKEAERLETDKIMLRLICNRLGLIFSKMGDYESALFYYNKDLNRAIELRDKKGEASALNNIALIFEKKTSLIRR
jgi:hypothetical protein